MLTFFFYIEFALSLFLNSKCLYHGYSIFYITPSEGILARFLFSNLEIMYYFFYEVSSRNFLHELKLTT